MDTHSPASRRHVIRQFVLGTAASWLGGFTRIDQVLASDAPPVETIGTVLVKVSDFPALASVGGSLRLDVGLSQPILINRSAAGFHALSAKCQHQGCTVEPYSVALGVIRCTCHGSQYNIDGSLNQGPATLGLNRFQSSFDGSNVVSVTVPGVTFAAREIAVISAAGNSKRLRLAFNASVFTNYQVHYRPTLSASPQVIPFALTAAGAATQTTYRNTVFDINNPLPIVTLYVDATGSSGFFSIVLLPTQV